MKYLKKFEGFYGDEKSAPVKTPTRTKPGVKPGKPSPIRRDRPAPGTAPAPKANLPKASAEDVVAKANELSKKYNK